MKNQRILPPRLSADKLIGIIAPADPVAGVCPPDVVARGYSYLKEKGFSVVEGESVRYITKKHTAGTIDLRVKDIHDFLKRNDIGCIMAFWGGFNTNQILDYLDYELIKKHPKIFIGYSDVTALTTAITNKTGLVTFSGPGVISFSKPEPFEYTWNSMYNTIINPKDSYINEPSSNFADDLYFLRDDNDHRILKDNTGIRVFSEGKTVGEVVVGNLQTLLLLEGTEYSADMTGKILFVEEDETSTPAHVDRFLCQCKHLGWLNKIAGLVFGRFTEYSGFSEDDTFEDLLNMYFEKSKFPVLYNVDFGHSDPLITIPNGGIASINTNTKEIKFEQSVC